MTVSMPHCKVHRPAKFRELTGVRRAPRHDPDHILVSALQYVKHKTGLGYKMWAEFIRDFPKVRDEYSGVELEQYDARSREIYKHLKHRDDKYMAAFANYMNGSCETTMRAYHKRCVDDPNARRPRCTSPVLRQGANTCVIYGRNFWCELSDAPNQPLLASPYVVLRFPIIPFKHTMEIQLTPYMVEKLATAVSVGAVTINDTTISVAFAPRPVIPVQPSGWMGMDVNKAEHVTANTGGKIRRIENKALTYAQTRRKKLAKLSVTGGKPKKKRSPPNHVKHPGHKPKNKSKRRDERVNRRERARINTRYRHQKNDWLFKLMHGLAALGFVLVLEEPTIDRLLKKSNKRISKETRDLIKMGLSQGMIWTVAKGVFKKHGLPVIGIAPKGTSSTCLVCGKKLWEPKYNTKPWKMWRRTKACVTCLYYVDRDDVAAINIVWRGIPYNEPAAGPGQPNHCSGRRVAGDWEQCVQQLLDAAVVWFPYVGEWRRPKGDAKNSLHVAGDARSLNDHLDASNCTTGVGPPKALYQWNTPEPTIQQTC